MDHESFRERIFHYALKDQKDPLEVYNKILNDTESSMDPTKRVDIDELPNRDWLRST